MRMEQAELDSEAVARSEDSEERDVLVVGIRRCHDAMTKREAEKEGKGKGLGRSL